ncbi:MAG: hypothetical protein ACO24O_08795 [Arenimonas sp.]
MAVKTHITGTSVSIGYETETADRAVIKCLATGYTTQKDAIDASVLAVGETLYQGTLNVPLVSAESTRWGDGKYIVTLQYGRNQRARRRSQTQRRIKIKSTIEYVDAYLVNASSNGGGYVNGYLDDPDPANTDWFSLQLRPGGNQSSELAPRPYKVQRPMMNIELEYTTAFMTTGDADLLRVGKINANLYTIGEIGGVFSPNTIKYEGFTTGKNDIGQFPWYTTILLTYDPSGHFRQQAVWDASLASNVGKWKTVSTFVTAATATF